MFNVKSHDMTRPDKIAKLWHRWSWLCHMVGIGFIAGMYWMGIQDTQANVGVHTTEINQLKEDFSDIKGDVRTIKESLRWIEKTMGRR